MKNFPNILKFYYMWQDGWVQNFKNTYVNITTKNFSFRIKFWVMQLCLMSADWFKICEVQNIRSVTFTECNQARALQHN
jgi:hypothetical protein